MSEGKKYNLIEHGPFSPEDLLTKLSYLLRKFNDPLEIRISKTSEFSQGEITECDQYMVYVTEEDPESVHISSSKESNQRIIGDSEIISREDACEEYCISKRKFSLWKEHGLRVVDRTNKDALLFRRSDILEYLRNEKNHDDMFNDEEACRYLNISRKTLWRWRKKKGLPYLKVAGGAVRYSKRAVDRWIASKTVNYGH